MHFPTDVLQKCFYFIDGVATEHMGELGGSYRIGINF